MSSPTTPVYDEQGNLLPAHGGLSGPALAQAQATGVAANSTAPVPPPQAVEQAPVPAAPPIPQNAMAPEDGQPQPGPSPVVAGTSMSSVAIGGTGWAEYTRRLRIQESSGNRFAKAPTSSARGFYQFLDDTWGVSGRTRNGQPLGLANTPEGQAAGLRPINPADVGTARDPRFDEDQQERALALFTQQNAAALRSNGFTVNGRNLYLSHFMGSGGALRMLGFLRDNPNLEAARVFPEAAGANRNVFYTPDGRARSVAEVYRIQTARFSDDAVIPERRATAPVSRLDVSQPPAIELGRGYTEGAAAAIRAQRGEEQRGFFGLIGQAWQRETPEGALLSAQPTYAIDPSFVGMPALKPFLDQMPAGYEHRLRDAVSAQHATAIVQKAKQDSSIDKAIEEAGWTGTGASVVASFLSPSMWVIGIGSGGLGMLAGGAMRVGRVGSRLMGAAAGAAGNVGYEGATAAAQGDEYGAGEVLMAATVGAAFGAAFGPLGMNPATRSEAVGVAAAIQRRSDEALGISDPTHMPGATSTGAAASNVAAFPEATVEPAWRATTDTAFPQGSGNTVADRLRISIGGQLATSPNVGTRALASGLLVDVVGKGQHINHRTADQAMTMLNTRFQASYASFFDPAYHEWATENGVNYWQRMAGARRSEFGQLIGRHLLTSTDEEIAALSPAMQRAIKHHGSWVMDRLTEKQDPSRVFGQPTGRRGIVGAENVSADARYVPVRWDMHRIEQAIQAAGYKPVERMVAGAIKNVQTQIDDDVAERLAAAVLNGPRNRAMKSGIDDQLSRALGTADIEKLRTVLKQEHEWADADIEKTIQQLSRGQQDAKGNLKRRIAMDYRAGIELPDGSYLRVVNLLDTNVEELMARYGRHHAGQMALGNYKVVNPETGDILFDGITSDADWAAALLQAERKAKDTPGGAERWARDKALLQYGYDRIRGLPDPAVERMGQVADWLRFTRAMNHTRVMNLMGLASLADIGRAVGSVTLKAFVENMSSVRRVMTSDGRYVLRHGLDRELEAAFGSGTDALRGFQRQVMADEFTHPGSNRLVDKANRVAGVLADTTNKISGQYFIQSWLELTTGRAAAARFAAMAARRGALSRSERNLVNFLGLDEGMLDRVLGQVRDNFTHEQGALFGRRLALMNLDKWTDTEARMAFEMALFRWTRTTIQQNDIGALHQVMSHPLAQVITQFRSFSIVAHENQLLQGIAMHDSRQLAMTMATTLSGILVYTAQSHLQAIGRSDADKFLEDRGFRMRDGADLGKLAAATYQRAGYSGLTPMVVDSALMFTPMKPVFNARSTGNPSDVVFGNPTASLIKSAAGASKSLMDALHEGRDLSQPELRAAFSLAPFQNALGISNTLSALISGRSEQRP